MQWSRRLPEVLEDLARSLVDRTIVYLDQAHNLALQFPLESEMEIETLVHVNWHA